MTLKTNALFICWQIAVLLLPGWWQPAYSSVQVGSQAPDFSLADIAGRSHPLASLKSHPMVMLYFFDADTKPSHEGLIMLDQLKDQYAQADLVVWAITLSERRMVEHFLARQPVGFPVLLDSGAVSKTYQADRILPTTCILGPDLKVLDLLQGGGKSTEVMLVRLAQRALQHRKSDFARALGDKVAQRNPDNVNARVVSAYAALDQGKLDESEAGFSRLAEQSGPARLAGMEGLSAVAAQKGQVKKALTLVRQVEQSDPSRGYVHVIKAGLLYSQNKREAAEGEYQKAIDKPNIEPYHRAKAFNQLARIRADQGRIEQAKALYDKAVAMDPYYIEATTNKGLLYEKEGRWDQAMALYSQIQRIDQADVFSRTLQKKLQAALQLEHDKDRKQRIDTLVKDLAARYRRRQQTENEKPADEWTSRPMVLTFVDFSQTGGLPARDGLATILTVQLADALNASGRVRVVERVIVDKLLQELNIGSSELADPANALELGKVLSAKLIITGTLYCRNPDYILTMRIIDTETTRIAKVINTEMTGGADILKDVHRLDSRILTAVIRQYPLQGYVVQADTDQVMINLGAGQGVVTGTRFDIVELPEPVNYRGKNLQALPKVIGQVEITNVETDFSRARIINSQRPPVRDDMLRERIIDATGSET